MGSIADIIRASGRTHDSTRPYRTNAHKNPCQMGRPHMTQPAQTLVSDVAPVHPRAPRSERRFFELVGPALKNQPLTFLCEDREYRYGSSAEPTVIRISDSGVFDRILTEGNLGLAECYMDKKV